MMPLFLLNEILHEHITQRTIDSSLSAFLTETEFAINVTLEANLQTKQTNKQYALYIQTSQSSWKDSFELENFALKPVKSRKCVEK